MGNSFAISMRKRITNLRDIVRLFNLLKAEIFYKKSVLKEACKNASLRCIYPYNAWLNNIFMNMEEGKKSFYEIWEYELIFLYENSSLKTNDMDLIREMGQALGHYDKETQKVNIDLELDEIHRKVLLLENELTNKMKIAYIGSFLAGLLIIISVV
ncbi:MAG: stage III sporulation protein AB [Lachnospiraceae bacterium]|nr:stage III sporulation protein AB [Lachnospiraceae bacterium]